MSNSVTFGMGFKFDHQRKVYSYLNLLYASGFDLAGNFCAIMLIWYSSQLSFLKLAVLFFAAISFFSAGSFFWKRRSDLFFSP
ncbi:unnamed protein product, partial [Larinioides sclopetarius]